MVSHRLAGIPAAAALLCAPVAVQAQTCDSLRAEMRRNQADALIVIADYPRTHAALLACYVGSNTENEAAACAAIMLGVVCFSEGVASCSDLISRWERGSRTYRYILGRMRAQGCAL